ncbi:MAG: 50S ribosomal protein L18 [Chloroflexota bacterium]
MISKKDTRAGRERRRKRVRGKIHGTSERLRLCVFRSSTHIYAQIIDDDRGHTLVAASTLDKDVSSAASGEGENAKIAKATQVGQLLARRAKEQGLAKVVFDRAGYLYHGRVKALADGARAGGLDF